MVLLPVTVTVTQIPSQWFHTGMLTVKGMVFLGRCGSFRPAENSIPKIGPALFFVEIILIALLTHPPPLLSSSPLSAGELLETNGLIPHV